MALSRPQPQVHVINFSFVPLHKRILVQNTLTIGWAAYLSHVDEEFEKNEQKNRKLKEVNVGGESSGTAILS